MEGDNMKRRVVITGIGIVSPLGNGKQTAWSEFKNGHNAIQRITKFDADGFNIPFAGEVKLDSSDYISPRLAKKMDLFSIFALVACGFALEDSKLDLEIINKDRVGICVGNITGGWTFTEPQLRNLHTQGVRQVSPYLASAWFPAAPQGQVSIFYGLKGYSKTMDGGRASGLICVGYGAKAIRSGKSDVLLAGGTEAIVTPYTIAACETEGITESGHHPAGDGCYRPFDQNRDGWVPGEGAVFLVLESLEHAIARDADIYCEVTGFGHVNEPCHPRYLPLDCEKGLARAMTIAMKEAEAKTDNVDLIMADALGTQLGDYSESVAIKKVVNQNVLVTAPKSMCGHLYGAAGALDTALAALSINDGCVPPTINIQHPDSKCGLNIVQNKVVETTLDSVLINSRGSGGISASLILNRFEL
jgi:3-oxoacyl-[acyl-carrier-protein] synthase II